MPIATTARTWRWPVLLVSAGLALTVLLWALRAWVWLGVAPINAERTPFSDTLAHLATAVNCANGHGEWHGRVCFVPDIHTTPRAQTYEPWLSLHRMGVDSMAHVYGFAIAMIVLFHLAVAASFRPRNAREMLMVFGLLATSGIQLGLERGNFDLLIACLLCLSGALLAYQKRAAAFSGIALLSLATMLKLYTGLACALAWLVTRAPLRWTLPASAIAIAAAVLVVGPRELLVLGHGAPEGGTRFSTGAHWLFLHAGADWGIAAIVLALLIGIWTWSRLHRAAMPDFRRWPRRVAVFQIAALTALPLFVLKDSYDYRLLLWLPMLALPFAMLRMVDLPRHWRALAIALLALFAFVSGVELPARWLDHLHATTAWHWPHALAVALSYGKQFAAWTLATLSGLLFAIVTHQQWWHVIAQRVRIQAAGKNEGR